MPSALVVRPRLPCNLRNLRVVLRTMSRRTTSSFALGLLRLCEPRPVELTRIGTRNLVILGMHERDSSSSEPSYRYPSQILGCDDAAFQRLDLQREQDRSGRSATGADQVRAGMTSEKHMHWQAPRRAVANRCDIATLLPRLDRVGKPGGISHNAHSRYLPIITQ